MSTPEHFDPRPFVIVASVVLILAVIAYREFLQ
jgi:hypothetical protein